MSRTLFFTGAGMSAESGVPTYRGRGGIWGQYRWEDFACQRAFERDPQKVLDFHEERRGRVLRCEPHAGHRHLALLQRAGVELAVVTQNTDGLHTRAGVDGAVELHGSLWRLRCPRHGAFEDLAAGPYARRRCAACDAPLRPDIVWFEDPLDPRVFARAEAEVRKCKEFVAVGTSAVVYPAAGLIPLARARRAHDRAERGRYGAVPPVRRALARAGRPAAARALPAARTRRHEDGMIPLKDDNPTRTVPFVNYALITSCVLVFLWQLSLGDRIQAAIYAYGLIPDVLLGDARLPPGLAAVPAWMTVFTSMFLHGGWMHLIGNMLYLWIFADNVEDRFGHGRFVVFYALCGIAAAMAQALPDPGSQIPMVGASGAISGVLGAYLLMFPRAHVLVLLPLGPLAQLVRLPALLVLGLWFAMQLLSELFAASGAGVAFRAHIGGFVAGLLLLPVFRRRDSRW